MKWDKESVDIIKKYYPLGDWSKLDQLPWTRQQIRVKAQSMGIKKTTRLFSNADKEWLLQNYETASWEKILERFPGKNKQQIISYVHHYCNIKRRAEYSVEELSVLKEQFENSNSVEEFRFQFMPTRSVSAIMTKTSQLGLRLRNQWTKDEDALLIALYPEIRRKELCQCFSRHSAASVCRRILILGLTGGHGYKLTTTEKEFIIQNYKILTDNEIGKQLNRSPGSIKEFRRKNCLYRHDKYDVTRFPSLNRFFAVYDRRRWRKSVFVACNGTCVLTGKRGDDAHHVYSRSLLVERVALELGLSEDFDINHCDNALKQKIIKTYNCFSSQEARGVCLAKEVHRQFHDVYGFGYNTPEQFLEFVSNFFPEKLEIIKKYLYNL